LSILEINIPMEILNPQELSFLYLLIWLIIEFFLSLNFNNCDMFTSANFSPNA
jgi:hypothetical protein